MKLEGISEYDLTEILFACLDEGATLQECRDSLELLIAECYDDDYAAFGVEERPEMVISPYWIFRAMCRKSQNEISRMSREEVAKKAVVAMKTRLENIARRGLDKQSAKMVEYAPW